jgi:vacuolar protein-sorting-associated protein 4
MQGVGTNNEGVLVLGATNLPWGLDPAIRRRFEKRIYIALPDEFGRLALLKNRLKTTPNTLQEDHIKELSGLLEG